MADAFWQHKALATIAHGRWHGPTPTQTITGVSIDTRTLMPGNIYVAIRGENHDGHAFVQAALDQGAAFAVIERAASLHSIRSDHALLEVDSTVTTLQAWAQAFREVLATQRCRVLAVAGSNGKTTVRHLLHHVLTQAGLTGTQSPKSFNNHLGVPLTLLAAQPVHDFVACEIGTNHPGEIATLAQLARPDAALLTSIGQEHLEHFGDLQGVAKEEAALLPHVRPHGVVFAQADAARAIAPHYDVQEDVALLPIHAERFADAIPIVFPLPGEHNRQNAALVVAAARWMGCADAAITAALASATPPEGRLQSLRFGDAAQPITVIHDAYNANPDSMSAALDLLAAQPGRRLALLGDMLELGDHTGNAHRIAREHALNTVDGSDLLWCVGEHFAHAQPWSTDLANRIASELQPGDTLLLKGSRGMRLERILPVLEARFGPALD